MSAQFPAYSPVENGGNGGGRPKSYHPPLPRFYAPPTISTPPSDSLKPTPPTSYRHSHSLSTVFAGGPGQPPVNVRERSSSHSLYPAPYYPGGTSAPNGQAPQSRSRSGSYSPHPMQLQPGSGQSSSRQSLSPLDGAYPSAPNGQVQQARPRSSSHSPHPMALQPGSGPSSRPRSPSISGAPSDQPPQTRSRSGSYSPHPMQLQPGSRPSSRPHSPSLSFTGGDELHFNDPNPSSSPRQPSPTSLHAITSALDQATQQPSLRPQDADLRSLAIGLPLLPPVNMHPISLLSNPIRPFHKLLPLPCTHNSLQNPCSTVAIPASLRRQCTNPLPRQSKSLSRLPLTLPDAGPLVLEAANKEDSDSSSSSYSSSSSLSSDSNSDTGSGSGKRR